MALDTWELGHTGVLIPEMRKLTEFLETYCSDELEALANEYPTKSSLYIKYSDVYKYSEGLTQAFEKHFFKIEPIIRQALAGDEYNHINAAGVLKYREDVEEITEKVKIRVFDPLPVLKQLIRNLGRKDIGHIVCVDGYVRLASDSEPKIIRGAFECLRCGHVTYVNQPDLKYEEPFAGCENETCGKKGPFTLDPDLSDWVDFQRIQIQEMPDSSTGTKTHDIIIECNEELVDIVKSGDRVTVTGVLMLRQRSGKDGKKTVFEKIINVLSLEKLDLGYDEIILTREDEEKIIELSKDPELENKIINSIAPSIHGNEEIKEALALQQFGGVKKILPDGTIQRGELHMQLIGDPAGAKTRLLMRAVQISPRGIYASGKATSAAGLTAAAVKDPLNEGAWVLEGGAAVMASGGLLAIDEIGQARDEDKSALHEVMENGTISVAKAGNVTTLNAECAILMAGNPINGYFDRYGDFAKQMGIPPALWSRVALTFIMLDDPDEKKDTAISNYILNNHRIGGMIQNVERAKNPIFTDAEVKQSVQEIEAPISKELLRMYIAYARMYIFPVASIEITNEITRFYLDVRRMKGDKPDNPVPITPRSVEDLQRLSEAHARMRLSNVITLDDVKAAKRLMITSLKQVGMDENGRLDAGISYVGRSKSQIEKIGYLTDAIKSERFEDLIYTKMKNEYGIDGNEVFSLLRSLQKSGKVFKTNDEYKNVQ